MTALTLRGLERVYKDTLKSGATPHRTPDFPRLKKVVDPDVPIKGKLWFIEHHNTGVIGPLHRWSFTMEKADGSGETVTTWADLLPDLISDTDGKTPVPLAGGW
jgi:hypothetical protein